MVMDEHITMKKQGIDDWGGERLYIAGPGQNSSFRAMCQLRKSWEMLDYVDGLGMCMGHEERGHPLSPAYVERITDLAEDMGLVPDMAALQCCWKERRGVQDGYKEYSRFSELLHVKRIDHEYQTVDPNLVKIFGGT